MIHEIKTLLAILGLFLVILLSSCVEHLNEGVVSNKKYYPAKTSFIYVNKRLLPIRISEKFCLTLENGEKTDLRCVSQKLYDSVKVGQYVVLGEEE